MGSPDIESGGVDSCSDDARRHEERKKKRKRKPKHHQNSTTVLLSSLIPSEIVCQPGTTTNAIELGLLFSLAVFGMFLLGFYKSVQSLPATTSDFVGYVGHNLNLANPGPRTLPDEDVQNNNNNNNFNQIPTKRKVQADGSAIIPPSKWPVSLRQEDPGTYDTVLHPGDHKTEMKVPKFWSGPVHDGKLMTRETAMKIGSCTQSDASDNHSRGDACPVSQRTIYVGIASYRDFECRSTVESIFNRAAHPERIRVGVVDQIVHDEDAICNAPIEPCETHPEQALCKYADQVDVYEMKAELSIGPVFARHIGYRLYRGEYYATQSDAHVTYTQNWDADIIAQLESTNNEMAVLSTYLTDVQGSIDANGKSLRHTRPIMCNTRYEGGVQGMHLRHGSQPERMPAIHGSPQLQPWWAAGYSFSRGHFVVNVPYDWISPMIFQGEEMSIGIRGFTIGYDFYAPERSVCFHHYAVGENAKKRNKVHHFWDNSATFEGTGKPAMKRLLGIVHMNPEDPPESWDHTEEDIYGIGGVRTPEKFYETFGIHVKEKTVENHLCRFVDSDGRMHKLFTPHLRKDGMGIDYSTIQYQFKDPAPNEK